jgi:type I restriction enzyme R subunit
VNKKTLTERDICSKFITPALTSAGWDSLTQIREQVHFTKGRIIVRGRLVTRGQSNFADYLIFYKPDLPIAVIEAKDTAMALVDDDEVEKVPRELAVELLTILGAGDRLI